MLRQDQHIRRHFWPLGIRSQLALWYVAVFTLLLLLSGTIFYLHLSSALATGMDSNLQIRAQEVANQITFINGAIVIRDTSGELTRLVDSDDLASTSTPTDELDHQNPNLDVDFDAFIRVLNPHGSISYTTPAFSALLVPNHIIAQAQHGIPQLVTIRTQSGQQARLYALPLRNSTSVFGVVLIGTSLRPLETTLQHIILELLIIAPLLLLLGALGSYWLATRAFRPIEQLTSTARTIKDGDLHSRVPVPQTNDEVQRLALTFNEMIDHLEKTFTNQRRFTADASHELRTPVAAIRSMTDVALAQEVQGEESATILRDVNTQAERLGHLISDLLTLARADEGHIHFEQERIQLDRLATDVAASLEWLAQERCIALEIHTAESAPVIGDEARLIQVMMNLLNNAFTYTNRGGTVTLCVETSPTQVYLKVRDTGIGIAPEHIGHIFERFYRTDSARSRTDGGTGLGLSIVEWIVHMHHGSIEVESQPGHGSTFTIVLPRAL